MRNKSLFFRTTLIGVFFLIFILFFSCKKDDLEDSYNYSFKIIYVSYRFIPKYYNSAYMNDSTVFYYDKNKRLKRVDQLGRNSSFYEYKDSSYNLGDVRISINSNNMIQEISNGSYIEKYIYNNYGKIELRNTYKENKLYSKEHFTFLNDNLIQDSLIFSPDIINLRKNVFTDTIAPDFMINRGFYDDGLYENPIRSKNLIRETLFLHSPFFKSDKGFKTIFSYEISENKLKQISEEWDLNNNELSEIKTVSYELIKN
jgi:hypothetical protein